MYTIEGRVRYSEVDSGNKIKLPAIVNYFQDCTTFQSEDMELGHQTLEKYGKIWILSSWQIEVDRYPLIGEKIKVDTWSAGFEGIYGHREFRMRTEDGEVLAWAHSLWLYMDMKKGRPTRPDESTQEAYGEEHLMEREILPRKITLPEEAKEYESFPVLRCQIDTNEHVNNCQYIQMALEVMPECGHVKKIRVEYKKSAVLGDWIYPRVAIDEERKTVELCTADGAPYAVVEFKEK